ncbi:hypothetical protein FHS43_000795 [Streptosporangium becharense]|uniref:Uncharacterized protein n=1 Tax=Streptosporangium becharense TaxID=1816182 RepID=A0A7W9MGJ4_9ACTN|nr:hypothetical protein [Streptosporangium becharense]MBB2909549.1 hypothetical protein [Streptosporangium becharense]MBB5819494.1 hypothetical protein [Streptosporangium becharense]
MRPEADPPGVRGSGPERPRGRRLHRTDWMAFLSGMLFVVVGIVFIAEPSVRPLPMFLAVVSGLGLAGLVAILAKVIRR